MVRKHYRDSVDIAASEQLTEIIVCGTIPAAVFLVNDVAGPISMRGINIANSSDLHNISAQEPLQVNCSLAARPAAADPDAAHNDPIACGNTAGLTECRRSN
jgi:phage FluMu protein gp41